MWGKSSLRVEGGAQELVLSYSLRHRMLYFLQNLLYYISYEVLEPRWHKLMQQLAHPSVKTVDDVRNLHMSFLSTVLKESLLTYGPLYKKLYQLISECAAFADRVQGTYLLTYLLAYLLTFTYLLTYLLTYSRDVALAADGGRRRVHAFHSAQQRRLRCASAPLHGRVARQCSRRVPRAAQSSRRKAELQWFL